MTDEDAKPEGLQVRRILLDMSPPQAAHGFGWARVADQFMLEVGYFDLRVWSDMLKRPDAKLGVEPPQPDGIDLFITNRFVMDIASAGRLVDIMKSFTSEYENIVEGLKNLAELKKADAHAE